jgi:IS30 family transposase
MGSGSGPAYRLSAVDRRELLRRVRDGETHRIAAQAIGCSAKSVQRLLVRTGGVPVRIGAGTGRGLSPREREEISRRLATGESHRHIARHLGRAPSTVSREVAANGCKTGYRAWQAEARARRRAARPKRAKLARCPRLRRVIEQGLRRHWSPQQICARLRADYPEDLTMRVSHETIYQSLFVQGRGALRHALTHCLRTGRTQRRPQGRAVGTGRLQHMVMITDRPAEANDRAVPGHWEGDLVLGQRGQSAIGTLVERTSRYVMLLRLPNGRLAEHVRTALTRRIQHLPKHLRRSVTWDQGKEMAQHLSFTVATGVQVYFCDPRSPWQRGTNENTNGLLRQYLPRSTDLSALSQAQLDTIARELNQRPRQTLGWQTPADCFAKAVATTG